MEGKGAISPDTVIFRMKIFFIIRGLKRSLAETPFACFRASCKTTAMHLA